MEAFQKKYEVQKVLGAGSFAEVLLTRQRKSQKHYAVKYFYKTSQNANPILEELKVFNLLRNAPHPNIVGCLESFEDDETLLLVYEYLPHGDLMSFLSKKLPSEGDVKKIFFGLVQAVKHLHSIGVVHRDIKLENICLGKGLVPKLIDFNLSCNWSQDKYLNDYCGSIYYCSPELFLRRRYRGPEADVWALGVVLFSLLFLRFPFNVEGDELWTCDQDGNAVKLPEEAKNRMVALKVVHMKYTTEPCRNAGKASDTVIDLIKGIFQREVVKRMTLQQIEDHKWLEELQRPAGEKKVFKVMAETQVDAILLKLMKLNAHRKGGALLGKKRVKSCDSHSFSSICKPVVLKIEVDSS